MKWLLRFQLILAAHDHNLAHAGIINEQMVDRNLNPFAGAPDYCRDGGTYF